MNPPTNLPDLQELEGRLLKGFRTVEPRATTCLEGTRTSILADVDTKTNDCDGPNIIHIYGAPGSGKSSISLTAKSRLHSQGRLVSYFRFDRIETTTTTSTSLWCHVAYGLARLFPSVLSHALQQLRSDKVELDSPMGIFTSPVENPLANITSPIDRPLVIIIDALDECGGLVGRLSSDRQILLQTLERWASLPKHFKILVTSRSEGDITRVLSPIRVTIEIPSGHFITENPKSEAAINSSNDIRTFLDNRFQKIRQRVSSLPADWPGSETMGGMVHRAAGIFMWATTATNFVDSGINPRDRLRMIMAGGSGSSTMKPLYSLYSVVLEIGFGDLPSDSLEVEILQFVLGIMVLAKRPLNNAEFMKLPTTEPVTQDMLDCIQDGLRSVIAPDNRRFVHKSFDDFLLSEECPSKYRISQSRSHYLLTKLCLKTMMDGLRFNICGLETSSLKNVDVPDIATKVKNSISPLLSYSCLFFADHLSLTPFHEILVREVQETMFDKLLFWFEAMSLLKEINRVSPSLALILKWLHKSNNDKFKAFLRDACRFVGAFGLPITQSAPHIYISALPFTPKNSFVAKHFLPHFPWIPALSTGKPVDWPSCIFTSEHHRGFVNCVAFSADEEYFVTGSDDMAICIFDSETGNLISGPFECDDSVHTVCFDPNDCQAWAGCAGGQVIGWDIQIGHKHLVIRTQSSFFRHHCFHCRFIGSQKIIYTGETLSLWNGETGRCEQDCEWEPNARYGNRPRLNSISPDGCYIAGVVGLHGTSIRIWKVVNGSKIQELADSHPQFEHPERISALSFSVDSKFVVSGSEDGTVRIWHASTGDTAAPLLMTGDRNVSAVAYSNNHLLASTSRVVKIWNALTHEFLGRLEGHTSAILDIALSRDGQRALTASMDGTVRMWDLGRRGDVLATNQTHTSYVRNVAFSQCGRKLASLDLCSIQGWDTNGGNCLFKCEMGKEYTNLIFSPDDSQVVACSGFNNIGVWNTSTGTPVFDGGKIFKANHVAFRSTDGMLVLCSNDGDVYTLSIENGVLQKIAELPWIAALSSDGLTAIVTDEWGNPRRYVWSTTTHQPLPLTFADDEYFLGRYAARWAYSPSGKFFACSHDVDQGGATLRVWDMQTGELAARFPTSSRAHCLAFSSDDRHIASSCRSQIWIFDHCAGELISGPWSGHTDNITTLAFSPDGKLLGSGAHDCQVRVWNVANMLGDSQRSGVGTHMEDGWVKDVSGNLLFWVPKDRRTRLVWPYSVPLGESEPSTGFILFRYGENWTECYSGGDSSGQATD